MERLGDAVDAVRFSASRKHERIGFSRKKRRHEGGGTLISVIAGQILAEANGTIEFDRHSRANKEYGFKTIWQSTAYHFAIAERGHGWTRVRDPSLTQRSESLSKHSKSLSGGFYAFVRYHHLGHGTEWPIYMISETVASRNVVVITLDPDYEVLGGKTAKEVAIERNQYRGQGSIVSHGYKAARLGQTLGEFMKSLRETVTSLRNEKIVDLAPRFEPDEEFEYQQGFHFDE
jgi:hypothetical protein